MSCSTWVLCANLKMKWSPLQEQRAVFLTELLLQHHIQNLPWSPRDLCLHRKLTTSVIALSGRRLEMELFLVTTSRDRKTREFLSLIPEIYDKALYILFSIFADVVVDLIPLQIGAYFPLHPQMVCFTQ